MDKSDIITGGYFSASNQHIYLYTKEALLALLNYYSSNIIIARNLRHIPGLNYHHDIAQDIELYDYHGVLVQKDMFTGKFEIL